MTTRSMTAPVVRFMRFVDKQAGDDGCWLWTGGLNWDGYGSFNNAVTTVRAHCFAYGQFVGVIGNGLELDHLCQTRACVRPDHLEAVTHLENVRRARNFNTEKTHCVQGHEFNDENTAFRVRLSGGRYCRACKRVSSRISKQKTQTRRKKVLHEV